MNIDRRTFNKLLAGIFATPAAFLFGKPAKTVTMGVDVAKDESKEVIKITGTNGYDGMWSVIHHDMLTGSRTITRYGGERMSVLI